jgi:hypothetical protein
MEVLFMARKKEFKDVRQLLAENLEKAYERWDLLYKNGGSDPFWCDGTNLNLVRNHILYYREQCEEVLEPKDYPEAYHKELPPVVPDDYMAKKGEIMQDAQNLYLTLTDAAGNENDPDVKSALEKELCALKVSFNSGSRELVALRNILRRNEYFPILKQHPVTDKIEKTIPLQVASSREKAVITAPNETQKPFFESKETLPVGQLSIFDYM